KPETFTNDNPFSNPLLMDRIAPLYVAAGAPQELPGKSLRNLVGLAIGLTPTLPAGAKITPKDLPPLQPAFALGAEMKDLPPAFKSIFIDHDLFGKHGSLDTIVSRLDARANTHPPRVAFEFNVLFTELGPIQCPAFRVQVADFDPQTGGPKYEYADNT